MKRKGKAPHYWYKCPNCGMKYFEERDEWRLVSKEQKMVEDYKIRYNRGLLSLKKLIRRLKKQKYLPVKEFRYLVGGVMHVINLDDFDKDGNPIKKQEEKKEETEETKEKAGEEVVH